MKRVAKIFRTSSDGKRCIAIDTENADQILLFLRNNMQLLKKFDLICDLLLNGYRNPDLYDKEDINKHCKNVTAMKFKGGRNPRIYCQELKSNDKTLFIIASELHESKKNQKNQHKEINLIERVASYEYHIE